MPRARHCAHPGEIKARQVLTVRLAEGSAEVKVSSVQARLA